MPGKNFKDLLENVNKRRLSQKLMDAYETNKAVRSTIACGLGFFATITFLITYPGNSIPMQSFFKQLSARSSLEFDYLQAISMESTKNWISVLNTGEYYLASLRKDRIEYSGFASQCFDLLNITLKKSATDKLFFFITLKSLGVYLYDTINLNPKILRNPEIKASLLSLMQGIRENCEFNDRISNVMNNTEWNSLFSLFLVICEYGTEEKISAYKDLNAILNKQRGILNLTCNENFIKRVFADTVSEVKEISELALINLDILTEDPECQKYFVQNFLVYNLLTKVNQKHPELKNKIDKIVKKLENKEIWVGEKLLREKQRLVELAKNEKDEVLHSLIKSFNV